MVNWVLAEYFQWNQWNLYTFIHENAFENIVWKMADILSRSQCVKYCVFQMLTNEWSLWLGNKITISTASGISFELLWSPSPLANNPDIHQGTWATHVPWCIPGSVTSGFLWNRWREKVPSIPGACATLNFTYLIRVPWYGITAINLTTEFIRCLWNTFAIAWHGIWLYHGEHWLQIKT